MEILFSALALGHHLIETGVDNKRTSRKLKSFVHGIGVGWALFFLILAISGRRNRQL